MSIKSKCSKDTINLYLKTATTGPTLGVQYVLHFLGAVKCCVQSLSASEVLDYSARGMKVDWQFFFSSDPGITPQNHIGIPDVINPTDATKEKIFHVKGAYSEDRPGKQLMWVVLGEFVSTRDRTGCDVVVDDDADSSSSWMQ
jgi:hypothetical protein